MASGPAASIVIPAYNEARGIARCLAPVAAVMRTTPLEVVVAANGCRDDTVAVARRVPGVQVLDLPEASKVGALNAADAVATAFPRIYLDADVVLEPEALLSMIEILSDDAPLLSAPAVRYDTDGSDRVVRAFYGAARSLPAATDGMAGRGVYGLSRRGRARFDRFPHLQGDDLFVTRLFAPEETRVAQGRSLVRAPRTWRDLVKVRTRIAAGNAELAHAGADEVGDLAAAGRFAPTTRSTVGGLARLAGSAPSRAPQVLAFVAVTGAARTRAHWVRSGAWHRDASTR